MFMYLLRNKTLELGVKRGIHRGWVEFMEWSGGAGQQNPSALCIGKYQYTPLTHRSRVTRICVWAIIDLNDGLLPV